MIKVMSLADIHLVGGLDTDEAKALLKIAEIGRTEKVDLVLVNGDVFHSISTPIQRLVFKVFLSTVCQYAQVVILRGNHDEEHELEIFHDPDKSIFVFEKPGKAFLGPNPGRKEMLEIHCLPHFNAGGIALQESSLTDFNEVGTGLFDELVGAIFNEVRTADHPSMVACHGTITEAHLDNGMIPKHDGIVLNGPLLSSIGCPVRCGHYHEEQEPHPNVRYSGSIALRNYGEKGRKGVIIDTWSDGLGKWLEPRFVELETTQRITIDAEWVLNMADQNDRAVPLYLWYCEDKNLWHNPIHFKGARVRFRYKVHQSDIPTLNAGLDRIRKFFEEAGVLELKLERDLIIETAVRSEKILKATNVLDMHLTWCEMKGLEDHIPQQTKIYNEIVNPEKEPELEISHA